MEIEKRTDESRMKLPTSVSKNQYFVGGIAITDRTVYLA